VYSTFQDERPLFDIHSVLTSHLRKGLLIDSFIGGIKEINNRSDWYLYIGM